MRLPLPVKLMLSYLLIVAIGAGPTFVYVRAKLQADLLADAASLLIGRGRRVARTIGATAASDRLNSLRLIGNSSVDRITFLSPHGDVLFDSELPNIVNMENHLGRPEVDYVQSGNSALRPSFVAEVRDADGVGISRRVSVSSGIDTLYAAMRVVDAHGDIVGILRIAAPIDRIETVTGTMGRFVRNAQAGAVSLAIGFSLLAAVLFMRPLQRVQGMVHSLSAGDLGAQVGPLGNDEVGDVGRALDQMATSLRRKLLAAGLGEALLSQLVEALPTACVVFAERGDIVAINGVARRSLGIEGPEAGKRMRDLAAQPLLVAAFRTAEDEGEPEPVRLPLNDHESVRGAIHVLKRPGMEPLRVFIGSEVLRFEDSLLPPPDSVQPRTFESVFAQARNIAAAALARTGVQLEATDKYAAAMVSDARDQLGAAFGAAIVDAVSGIFFEGQGVLRIEVKEEATRLHVQFDAAISQAARERIAALVDPLGGAVAVKSAETDLWLPRA